MRAARVHAFDQPLQLDDVPEPEAGEGEAVVRLDHAGVNPLDVRICAGGAGRIPLPFTPGLEGVGTTDQGRVLVYGEGIGMRRAGTYAEQVVAPVSSLVPLDDAVDAVQAAGLGLAAVTAWGALHRSANVAADDRVLVLGASGGVGNLVVQLAREAGATVCSQVSTEADADVQSDLGADETVVVGDPAELRDALGPLRPTVVIDPLGGEFTPAALRALEPGGRIVVFGVAAGDHSTIDLSMLYRKAAVVTGHAALTTSPGDVRRALESCLASLAAGRLQVHVDEILPLERVNEAHARLVDRNVTGKLVLSVGA